MVNQTHDPTMPAWKGLFEWSVKQQTAGDGSSSELPREHSKEDAEWLQQALAANMVDVAQRMMDIKGQLDLGTCADAAAVANLLSCRRFLTACMERLSALPAQAPDAQAAPTLEQREALLDELLEIVEDVDFARDLRGIGGLPTLLKLLADPQPGIRSRAAGIVAASAQSNEPVQLWLLNGGALPPLLQQTWDADDDARASAWTGISCLVRHCDPALDAFLQADGLGLLAAALRDSNTRVQRKGSQLAGYTLGIRPGLTAEGAVKAEIAQSLPLLLGSGDQAVREAALKLALTLARSPASAEALFQAPEFEAALKRLRIALEDAPDADAVADELSLAAALAAAPRDASHIPALGGGIGVGSGAPDVAAAAAPLLLGGPS